MALLWVRLAFFFFNILELSTPFRDGTTLCIRQTTLFGGHTRAKSLNINIVTRQSVQIVISVLVRSIK